MVPKLPLDELSTTIARIKGLLLDSRGRLASSSFTDRVVEQADALPSLYRRDPSDDLAAGMPAARD